MSDIEQILYPTVLTSFREETPPVNCIIWKGGDNFETITFDKVYPFDTIDDIKRMICTYYKDDPHFIPKFTFVGVPLGESAYNIVEPSLDSQYISIDYLWYPSGVDDPKRTYILNNPRKTLVNPDQRFVTSDGSYASPNYEPRGRSTIEKVFLKPRDGQIPVFHVFPLYYLLREFQGTTPISEEDWNKRFAPYFPNVPINGPYDADEEDLEFAKKIHYFIEKRESTLDILNNFLEEGVEIPNIKISGIKQLKLIWKKPIKGFEGVGSLFYRIPVTERIPFIRLLPAEGSGVTKLHVKGTLPIPSLEDPKILEVWGKETTPTIGKDYTYLKYIHRSSQGVNQPIYGTVQIFNDGTINLLLQPPKQIRRLDPIIDFRNFSKNLQNIFIGLPQEYDKFELGELAAIFTLKTNIKSPKFTKQKLLQRLPYFQSFFQPINPLPNETPIISLRYKAVSQYATEDKTFTFLTQYTTNKILEGDAITYDMIDKLQEEFQISRVEARIIVDKWFEQRGTFTLTIPEEGEFIESFNPGIDIHVYAQHPSYFFHINRLDSYESYIRIYSLLSLLFIENDEYFTPIGFDNKLSAISEELEQQSIKQEEHRNTIEEIDTTNVKEATAVTGSRVDELDDESAVPDYMMDLMMEQADIFGMGETIPEEAPNPVELLTSPKEETLKKRPQIGIREEVKVEEVKPQKIARDEDEQKLVNPNQWFIKKLQEIDRRLFAFPSASKDSYATKCQDHDDRQPAVLTKDQYERMREIYEDDNIFFLVYPLEGTTEPIQPVGTEETYTLMRFGSDGDNINYYFCPLYYCLSDEIMIRPRDFEATKDRDGNSKPPNTCPFCKGKLITNKKKALPGYTVVKRKNKKDSTESHTLIKFMSKTTHPEEFALPCCFLTSKSLRITDPEFKHIKSSLQDQQVEELNEKNNTNITNIAEEEYEGLVVRSEEAIEYGVLFETLHKRYILESNKQPDAGIFATASPEYDTFFAQNSGETVVTRVAIHLKLRPNGQGFLRIGTENSTNESLLGVIAPILYKNSINEVRERILEVVNPRVFVNSHFGNLVLEFYNPSDTSAMPSTEQELKSWASKELQVDVNSNNKLSLQRVYNSFKRFIRFIRDPMQRKDLRHIQPLLAEPGLFTSRGIQLVIMDKNEDGAISVKCPTFGVSMDRHKKSDFIFISREIKNIKTSDIKYAKYELYIYTNNSPARGGERETHETIVTWDYASRRFWPSIVQKRVDEYMSECQSRYRSIYTSQQGINPMAMIPISKAIEASPKFPVGVIRDSYNHIIGITFRSKPGRSTLVTLPVIDDGFMPTQLAIHFDWNDFTPAPVEDIVEYYKNTLEPLFSLYPGYIIKYAVRSLGENKIIALQLENGIYIPSGPPRDESSLGALGLNVVTVEEFEWSINKDLTKPCGTDEELVRKSSYGRFEELYQQFRLMVSNWITSSGAGGEIRKGIEKIIFNEDLPEYEKRKRMYIYLGSTLLSWFYPDEEKWEAQATFLRKDCRVLDTPESCSGTCYWKKEGNTSGKCLLHVDAITELGEREVSTPDLFTKRIIDELVRFPIRRKQLMRSGDISKISTIIEPIRQGDQYIIPESSPTWTNLLRLEWTKETLEMPKYYEEMSREETEEDKHIPKGELPSQLLELLGEDTHLRLWVPELSEETLDKPLLPFTAILGMTLSELDLEPTATSLSKDNLVKYVKKTTKPIGIIDLTITASNQIQFVRPMTGSFESVTIFVFLPDQIGLLIETDGISTVRINNLPKSIQERWKEASIVMLRKTVISENKMAPVIVGTNVLRSSRRRPQIGKLAVKQPELQEAPLIKRKPQVGVLPIRESNVEKNIKEEKDEKEIKENIKGTIAEINKTNVSRSQTRKRPRALPLPAPSLSLVPEEEELPV